MIEIDVVNAAARQDGTAIDLPPRELALLTCLAIGPRAWPSYQLVPLLWPQTPAAFSSSLKVYVHRLRRRLGPTVILSTNRGYELDCGLHVPLWEIQAILKRPELSEEQRQLVSHFYFSALRADRSFLTRWPWFAGTEALIGAELGGIARRLADEALLLGLRDEAARIIRSVALCASTQPRIVQWQASGTL